MIEAGAAKDRLGEIDSRAAGFCEIGLGQVRIPKSPLMEVGFLKIAFGKITTLKFSPGKIQRGEIVIGQILAGEVNSSEGALVDLASVSEGRQEQLSPPYFFHIHITLAIIWNARLFCTVAGSKNS